MSTVIVNGHPWNSLKAARSMDALMRAAQGAADLETFDAVLEAFTAACASDALTRAEGELVHRSMERALSRLEHKEQGEHGGLPT